MSEPNKERKDNSIGLWWSDDEFKCYKAGKPQLINGVECWVNLYPVDPKKQEENPKLPDFNLQIKPAKPRSGYASPPQMNKEIPF